MDNLEKKFVSHSEYEQIYEKMKEYTEKYTRDNIDGNRYNLFLANGDYISIKIGENQIAHLLGLNVDLLRRENIVKSSLSSYQILNYFLDNITYYTLKNRPNGEALLADIFSDYISQKIAAFNINSRIRPEEIEYIIKYDREKTYQSQEFPEKVDYFIIRKNNDKYYVLGIVKNEEENNYLPMTSRLYESEEELNKFLNLVLPKQEITYLSKSTVKNSNNGFGGKFFQLYERKRNILNNILNLADRYNASAVVGKEFAYTLASTSNNYQKNDNNQAVINLLIDSIKSNNILSNEDVRELIGDFPINQNTQVLIDVCNDKMCNQSVISPNNMETYSSIQKENEKMKQELIELKEALSKIQNAYNSVVNENQELSNINSTLKASLDVLMNAFNMVNSGNVNIESEKIAPINK